MGKSGSASAVSARKPHMHAANGAADHLLHSSGAACSACPSLLCNGTPMLSASLGLCWRLVLLGSCSLSASSGSAMGPPAVTRLACWGTCWGCLPCCTAASDLAVGPVF